MTLPALVCTLCGHQWTGHKVNRITRRSRRHCARCGRMKLAHVPAAEPAVEGEAR